MSSRPVIFVSNDIYKRADILIKGKSNGSIKDAVELLLLNDLCFGGIELIEGPGRVDAGELLQRGLTALANAPHEALGVTIGASTQEIRKAYKKMALKYHPDKNPKTTTLFQIIKTAADKLVDRNQGIKEPVSGKENTSTQRPAATSFERKPQEQQRPAPPRPPPTSRPSYTDSAQQQKNRQDAEEARKKAAEETKRQEQKRFEASRRAQQADERKRSDENVRRQEEEYIRKAGERAYAKEQERLQEEMLRRAEMEREKARQAEEAARQRRRRAQAQYTSMPTTSTPDEDESAQNKADFERASNIRYFRSDTKQSGGVSGGSGRGSVPTTGSGSGSVSGPSSTAYEYKAQPTDGGGESSPSNPPLRSNTEARFAVGRTFTVGANGAVKMSSVSGATSRAAPSSQAQEEQKHQPTATKSKPLSTPSRLRCKSLEPTVVELEWDVDTETDSKGQRLRLLFELHWRDKAQVQKESSCPDAWSSPRRLLATQLVRKKNLIPGTLYEFRVRAVVELSNGNLGDRSDWSDSLALRLPPEPCKPSATTGNANDSTSATSSSTAFDSKRRQGSASTDSTGNNSARKTTEETRSDQHKDWCDIRRDEDNNYYDNDDDNNRSVRPDSNLRRESESVPPQDTTTTQADDSTDARSEWEKRSVRGGDCCYYLAPPPLHPNYEHSVRQKASSTSIIVGYLVSGVRVQSKGAIVGDWVLVKCHYRNHCLDGGNGHGNGDEDVYGWTPSTDGKHTFLNKVDSYLDDGDDDEEGDYDDDDDDADWGRDMYNHNVDNHNPDVDLWCQMFDENGVPYYYNSSTGESQWTAPEWVAETDTQSGATYYVKLDTTDGNPLHSTWTKPERFSRLFRDEHASEAKQCLFEEDDYDDDKT